MTATRSGRLAFLLGATVFATGCGPIPAPPGAADVRENPATLASAFDRDAGRARLLLLLSPG